MLTDPPTQPVLPNNQSDPPASWGWRECVTGIVLALVTLVTLVAIASVITRGKSSGKLSQGQLLTGLVLTLLFEAALFAIAVAFTAGRYAGGLRLLGWRPKPVGAWIGTTALTVILSYVTLGIYSGITYSLRLHWLQPKSNVPDDLFKHGATVVPVIVLTVFTAPVAEETFFRGFLFGGLRRGLGFVGAATISGMLFAIAHGEPTLIIPFTVIGVLFANAYRRTGTLWANVSAHFCFNLISVVLTLATIGSK